MTQTEPDWRVITLWQPMCWAIAHAGKNIENRTWKPPTSLDWLAIHAGTTYHEDHAHQIEDEFGISVPPRSELVFGAIIAICRVSGYAMASDNPWFSGPYGWILQKVKALPEPQHCKGSLGLWRPPDAVREYLDRFST